MARLLVDAGASCNVTADITTGPDRFTRRRAVVRCPVLHAAVRRKKTEMVAVLLEGRAEVDLQDATGDTALGLAALNHDVDSVRLLVDFGARPTLVNNKGRTPLQLAQVHAYPSVEVCNELGSQLGGATWVHHRHLAPDFVCFANPGERKAGIGIVLSRVGPDGRFVLNNLAVGGAAHECGLIKCGDVLLNVDGQEVTGFTIALVVALVLGDEGSETVCTLEREGLEYQVTLTRGFFNSAEDSATMTKAAR
mmetsp:Transcript_6934/g.16993  ORF Transcript_6934/g.16993 Transcript_6934/m.16993 type:complete len:251 (-) Transcript_6934:94-846(-)